MPQDTNPAVTLTSPSPRAAAAGALRNLPFYPSVRQEALNAPVYDIIPTIAAPHSTSINAITALPDMRWVFTGGTDGYIRKFNWVDTANGKLALTVAQRHPFVDSVTKAGVLLSYWENEDPANTSENLSSRLFASCSQSGCLVVVWPRFGRNQFPVGAPPRRIPHNHAQRPTPLPFRY